MSTTDPNEAGRERCGRGRFGKLRPRPVACLVAASMIFALTACDDEGPPTEPDPEPNPSATSDEIVPLPFFVENSEGVRLDSAAELTVETSLYDDVEGAPIMSPDDRHVQWGEWSGVTGSISVECVEEGTEVELQLDGLIPNGVYTLWNVTLEAPGFTGAFAAPGLPANVVGFGPSGPADGNQSAFTASADGGATISTLSPPGDLGVMGEIAACALTDEYEWHVVGLYHIDGQTYGSERGPSGTRAEQFAFIFQGGSQ